jgi:hypothetical protein
MKFKGLLWETLKVQTVSRDMDRMQDYILARLEKFHTSHIDIDSYGNIMATRGETDRYPTFVAHMDTVHQIVPNETWKPSWKDDVITAPTGIGGDDKVGIAICLWAIRHLPIVKVIFTCDEEIGAIGAESLPPAWLADSAYLLQADRRGDDDIVFSYSGRETVSEKFRNVAEPIAKKFGYTKASGALTDVLVIGPKYDLSAINISCGYTQPHSKNEKVSVKDATTALNLLFDLYRNLGVVHYPHKWKSSYRAVYSGPSRFLPKPRPRLSYGFTQDHNYPELYVQKTLDEHLLELYNTTQNPVYEWFLYYCGFSDEMKELIITEAKDEFQTLRRYLQAKFQGQIYWDLRQVGYEMLEIELAFEKSEFEKAESVSEEKNNELTFG